MASIHKENWQRHHAGVTWLSAAGTRHVLIVASEEPESEEVIYRKKGELSPEDKKQLKDEGIASENWHDDADLMRAKYFRDYETMKDVDLKEKRTKPEIIDRIRNVFNNTQQDGVTIHYIGPGRIHTGDWCFKGGFITFEDVAGLYMQYSKGKTLVIAADCSYSGKWVEACQDFLIRHNVQPCGHSARTNTIKIKVFCSCQPHEIGNTLLYSARGNRTDKETGAKYVVTDTELSPGQTTCFLDSTKILCGGDLAEPCKLRPGFSYEEKTRRSRIIHKFQETKGNWRVILLTDNMDVIKKFTQLISGDCAKTVSIHAMRQYGQISTRAFTSENAEDWIKRMNCGIEDIEFNTDFENISPMSS